MLIAVATLLAQVSVEGLRADESLAILAPNRPTYGTEAEEYINRCGRVVDAFTLQPVVGAQVEVWTEEITEETGGFRRLGFAHTGETGQFILTYKEGDVDADKSRISAEGYATLTLPAGEITFNSYTRLFPIDRPLEVRFVDTDGRAIQAVPMCCMESARNEKFQNYVFARRAIRPSNTSTPNGHLACKIKGRSPSGSCRGRKPLVYD